MLMSPYSPLIHTVDLIPFNLDRLQALLSPLNLSFDATNKFGKVLCGVDFSRTASSREPLCRMVLYRWLSQPSPSWKHLGKTLAVVKCLQLSREILDAIPNYEAGT